MKYGDTSLGGAPRSFPETSLDVVALTQSSSPEARRAGFEELTRRYWKPVYHYIRLAWAKSNDDAKDLTQAFFLWLMEGNLLDKYDRTRAGFRTYLKALLRNFHNDKEEALHRLKRGGGIRHVSLDWEARGLEAALSDPSGSDPDRAFDDSWRKQVLAQVLNRVKERWIAKDQGIKYRVFEEYYLPQGPDRPTYGVVARSLGIKESDVLHCLSELREAIREELRRELSFISQKPEELEEEWHAFFAE